MRELITYGEFTDDTQYRQDPRVWDYLDACTPDPPESKYWDHLTLDQKTLILAQAKGIQGTFHES